MGNSRPAWALIASEVYKLNYDTEKSLVINRNINQEAISKAEKKKKVLKKYLQKFSIKMSKS